MTDPVSKSSRPIQTPDQISTATSQLPQRKDTLSERGIWAGMRAIYWYTGFDASDPDKLPLVEVSSLKVIDQDFFGVLEMYFSDSVPKGFIILLA